MAAPEADMAPDTVLASDATCAMSSRRLEPNWPPNRRVLAQSAELDGRAL